MEDDLGMAAEEAEAVEGGLSNLHPKCPSQMAGLLMIKHYDHLRHRWELNTYERLPSHDGCGATSAISRDIMRAIVRSASNACSVRPWASRWDSHNPDRSKGL